MKNLYEILGVSNEATQDEIKKAYRTLSKEHHPDKGGDEEVFKTISEANEILKDPERRKRYDETGETKKDDFNKRFIQFVLQGLAIIDSSDDIEHLDLISMLKDLASDTKRQLLSNLITLTKSKKKHEKAALRIRRKDSNDDKNVILHLIQSRIEAFKRDELTIGKEIEFAERVLETLQDYDFDFDDLPKLGNSPFFNNYGPITTSKGFDDFFKMTTP